MESESFYAVTLSEKDPLQQFEVPDSREILDQKLIIKQICLGEDAKEDEFNVVQVETTYAKETIKIPIAVLKAGETRVLRPNVEFPGASVTFKLIKGTGPVYIYGQHLISEVDMVDHEEEDIEDEYDEDELIQQANGANSNKKYK